MKYINLTLFSTVKYLINARKDPANTLLDISERYGEVVHLRIGTRHMFLVTGPNGVKHVLQNNQHNYRGFRNSYKHFRPLLGNGLLTSDGEAWYRHRRLIQPAFHPKQLRLLSTMMTETIQQFLTRWEIIAERSGEIDIGAEFTLLTLSLVTRSLFGTEIGEKTEILKNSVPKVLHYLINGMFIPQTLPEWVPTRKNREYRKALASLNLIVEQIISSYSDIHGGQTNLLEMLLAARDHGSDIQLSGQELRDEIMTILIAGHETCSNALTWTFYYLALNPEIQDQVADEVENVLHNAPPTYDEVHQLTYAHMVFNEVLRLFPPAWIMARDVIAQDIISGYPIPADSLVILSPYVNHRLTSLWENPSQFDPERFAPSNFNMLPKFAFFPFGGGQRLCLGKNFAILEAMLSIALIIQRFKFTFPQICPENCSLSIISPDIDMRPKNPIILKIERR